MKWMTGEITESSKLISKQLQRRCPLALEKSGKTWHLKDQASQEAQTAEAWVNS